MCTGFVKTSAEKSLVLKACSLLISTTLVLNFLILLPYCSLAWVVLKTHLQVCRLHVYMLKFVFPLQKNKNWKYSSATGFLILVFLTVFGIDFGELKLRAPKWNYVRLANTQGLFMLRSVVQHWKRKQEQKSNTE